MNNDNKIWNDMARFLSDEMDENEKVRYLEEVRSDHAINSQLEEMKSTWKSFDNEPSLKFKDTGMAWNKLKGNLERDGLLEDSRESIHLFFLRPAIRIAATILLILGLGFPGIYFTVKNNRVDPGTISHVSASGVISVDLPDGSRVFMNQGAEISYPTGFNGNRTLELQGEAFFEVMADPGNPFRVRSGKVIVSVLGTSFNVKQQEKSDCIEVFVQSGEVQVSGVNNSRTMKLLPGEFVYSDGREMRQGNLENLNYLSWKTKEFIFVDEAIDDIFETLEKAYHVEIVTGNLDVDQMRLTSTYKQQSIDAILETISTAFNLEIKKEGETYYLN